MVCESRFLGNVDEKAEGEYEEVDLRGGEKKVVPKLRLMAIFASDGGLELLANAKELAMDGTFDSSPKPFKQIFVIQVGLEYCECKVTYL